MTPADMSLEDALELLALHVGDFTIATAESVTAGRIARSLATIPGAQEFLRGGLVAYQEYVKRQLLGVQAVSIYSPECAWQMARGVARMLEADVAVATTGLAGGDPIDGVPVGTVFVGIAIAGTHSANRYQFDGSPDDVADQAGERAVIDLALAISNRPGT